MSVGSFDSGVRSGQNMTLRWPIKEMHPAVLLSLCHYFGEKQRKVRCKVKCNELLLEKQVEMSLVEKIFRGLGVYTKIRGYHGQSERCPNLQH